MKEFQPLRVGDTIICKGIKAVVGEILFQDAYSGDYTPGMPKREGYYDIEFKDREGKYRHWKSSLDGGYVDLYMQADTLEEYKSALANTLKAIESCRSVVRSNGGNRDIKQVIIKSLTTGNIRLRINFIDMDSQETELGKDLRVISTRLGTLTPLLSSISKALRKDMPSVCSLNPNINEIVINSNYKYITRVSIISQYFNGEDKIILS